MIYFKTIINIIATLVDKVWGSASIIFSMVRPISTSLGIFFPGPLPARCFVTVPLQGGGVLLYLFL